MEQVGIDWGLIARCVTLVMLVLMWLLWRYLAERERQKTLRAVLERGAALEPALLQQLLSPPRKPKSPHGLLVGGLVTVAFAIGLFVLGLCIGLGPQGDPEALKGLSGSAGLFFFVGAALLVADRLVKRSSSRQGPHTDEPGV